MRRSSSGGFCKHLVSNPRWFCVGRIRKSESCISANLARKHTGLQLWSPGQQPSHDKDQASAPFWCPGERVVLFAHVFFFSVFFLLVFIHKQTCFEASETTAVLLKIFAILCFIFDTRILKIQVYLGFHFFGLRSSFVPYHQTTAISDSQPTHRSEGEGCHMTFTHILMTLK